MEQMRLKHNKIKTELLQNAVDELRADDSNRQITLLDLGIGRANDVNKWNQLNITNIIGVDSREEQLNEARKRTKSNKNIMLYKLDLTASNSIETLQNLLHAYKFDIVVCFFSIHYFIKNVDSILTNVQLADDCIFLATFMNLRSSMFVLNEHFENDYIYMKRMPSNQIEILFKDTPYFNSKTFNNSPNIENLIDDSNVKYAISKHFQASCHVRSFVDYYENIKDIDNDVLLVELMHSTLYAKK
jgi:hypothetical protein